MTEIYEPQEKASPATWEAWLHRIAPQEQGMKKKNEENRHAESFEESLETLFGRESDLTDEELDEEFDACGIDAAELQADVHKQLFDYANHHYRTLDKDVPENLEKTLRALRPPSAAEKAKASGTGRRKISSVVFSILQRRSRRNF